MMKHLDFAGLDTATADGGAGGIGKGILGPASTGALTGAGTSSAVLLIGFSSALYVTVTPEVCLAIRGSLRVLVTEDTAGVTGAGARAGCVSILRS